MVSKKIQIFKNGLWFNVWDGSKSSINLIPTDVFWPRNHWRDGVWVKLHPRYVFWIGNSYWLTLNLAHIPNNLKIFKKAKKNFLNKMWYFYWHHHMSPCQCLVLSLISAQERARKHCLRSLIQNKFQKETS